MRTLAAVIPPAAVRAGLALCALLAVPSLLEAQCTTRTGGPYTLTVTPGTVQMTADPMDFEQGIVEPAVTVRVRVTPNQPSRQWSLCLVADDVTLGGYGKPIEDLLWRPSGQSDWQSTTPAGSIVALGTGTTNVDLEFSFAIDALVDVADVYAAGWSIGIAH